MPCNPPVGFYNMACFAPFRRFDVQPFTAALSCSVADITVGH